MAVLTAIYGIAVGVSLGLTGGGGSILAVPLLVYGLGVAPQQAVSVSLAAVGAVSVAGAIQRLVRREVELRTGVLFAISGVVGAPLGTWISEYVSDTLLLFLFAGLMLLVAVRMWIKAKRSPEEAAVVRASLHRPEADTSGPACRRDPEGRLSLTSRCLAVLLVSGLMTGVLSGLFGVGGGFVIVPALVLLTNLNIHRAVATSLLVIGVISAAGLVSHMFAGRELEAATIVPFSIGGLLGLGLGTWGGRRISPVLMQKIFAVVIVAVAVYVIIRNLA